MRRRARRQCRCAASLAACGNFCRAFYRRVNHTRSRGWRYQAGMRIQRIERRRCAAATAPTAAARRGRQLHASTAKARRFAANASLAARSAPSAASMRCSRCKGSRSRPSAQRAVKRGRNALDALDALKLGLLAGTLRPATLARLKSATADLREQLRRSRTRRGARRDRAAGRGRNRQGRHRCE